jgi:hypothetical protein
VKKIQPRMDTVSKGINVHKTLPLPEKTECCDLSYAYTTCKAIAEEGRLKNMLDANCVPASDV